LLKRHLPITVSRYEITHISAANFDFSPFHSSTILRSSLIAFSNVENMGIVVGISLLLCIEAEIYAISYLYFRLMAAIFDFSIVRTSDSLRGSLIVSSDLENMGIDVGISFLSCIETELRLISFFQLPCWISDFRFHPTVFLMVPLKIVPPKT